MTHLLESRKTPRVGLVGVDLALTRGKLLHQVCDPLRLRIIVGAHNAGHTQLLEYLMVVLWDLHTAAASITLHFGTKGGDRRTVVKIPSAISTR